MLEWRMSTSSKRKRTAHLVGCTVSWMVGDVSGEKAAVTSREPDCTSPWVPRWPCHQQRQALVRRRCWAVQLLS